jgi:hypothetical protein
MKVNDMTNQKEYPLIENLEAVKRKKFATVEDRLTSIIAVLDEEVLSRGIEHNPDRTVPEDMVRQSKFRWDVAGCVFTGKKMLNAMQKQEVTNIVTKNYLLCVHQPEVFYDMAAMMFYNFYNKDSGSGLTADENNEIIRNIFGNDFDKLQEAFDEWLVEHIEKMLIPHPTWTSIDPVKHLASQSKYYQESYKGAFFMSSIEKAIQNVTNAIV